MSNSQASTFTDSALSDKVKEFLIRFKDKNGEYKYVNAIDEMMPKNAKYIIVDYNDLVVEPQIEIIFSDNPDRLFDAFSRAIKEALQTRFSDYAEKNQGRSSRKADQFSARAKSETNHCRDHRTHHQCLWNGG